MSSKENKLIGREDHSQTEWKELTKTDIGNGKHALDVAAYLKKSGNALEGVVWDYFKATYPSNTTEVYTYRNGGSSGTVTAIITVVYTSASKNEIDDLLVQRF